MNNVIITSILIPLFVAIIVSLITAYFSLRRFRKERVWDLKIETYDSIFSALYDLDEFWRNILNEYTTGDEPDDWDEIEQAFNNAKFHLGEVVFRGEFIINKDAIKVLHRLTKSLNEKEPGFIKDMFTNDTKESFYKKQREILKMTLRDLRSIARKDIKV